MSENKLRINWVWFLQIILQHERCLCWIELTHLLCWRILFHRRDILGPSQIFKIEIFTEKVNSSKLYTKTLKKLFNASSDHSYIITAVTAIKRYHIKIKLSWQRDAIKRYSFPSFLWSPHHKDMEPSFKLQWCCVLDLFGS